MIFVISIPVNGRQEAGYCTVNDGLLLKEQIGYSTTRVAVPLNKNWSIGAEYQLMLADCIYEDYPDVKVRRPEIHLFTALLMR